MSQRCAPGSSRLPGTVTGTAAAPSAASAGAVLSPGLHPPPPGLSQQLPIPLGRAAPASGVAPGLATRLSLF